MWAISYGHVDAVNEIWTPTQWRQSCGTCRFLLDLPEKTNETNLTLGSLPMHVLAFRSPHLPQHLLWLSAEGGVPRQARSSLYTHIIWHLLRNRSLIKYLRVSGGHIPRSILRDPNENGALREFMKSDTFLSRDAEPRRQMEVAALEGSASQSQYDGNFLEEKEAEEEEEEGNEDRKGYAGRSAERRDRHHISPHFLFRDEVEEGELLSSEWIRIEVMSREEFSSTSTPQADSERESARCIDMDKMQQKQQKRNGKRKISSNFNGEWKKTYDDRAPVIACDLPSALWTCLKHPSQQKAQNDPRVLLARRCAIPLRPFVPGSSRSHGAATETDAEQGQNREESGETEGDRERKSTKNKRPLTFELCKRRKWKPQKSDTLFLRHVYVGPKGSLSDFEWEDRRPLLTCFSEESVHDGRQGEAQQIEEWRKELQQYAAAYVIKQMSKGKKLHTDGAPISFPLLTLEGNSEDSDSSHETLDLERIRDQPRLFSALNLQMSCLVLHSVEIRGAPSFCVFGEDSEVFLRDVKMSRCGEAAATLGLLPLVEDRHRRHYIVEPLGEEGDGGKAAASSPLVTNRLSLHLHHAIQTKRVMIQGGAMVLLYKQLSESPSVIEDSVFEENHSGYMGGSVSVLLGPSAAVYSTAGLFIQISYVPAGSVFKRNRAYLKGGAVSVSSFAKMARGFDVKVRESVFEKNQALPDLLRFEAIAKMFRNDREKGKRFELRAQDFPEKFPTFLAAFILTSADLPGGDDLPLGSGGAIHSSTRIVQTLFSDLAGRLDLDFPSLELDNCTFRDNEASNHAGAVSVVASSLNISKCLFEGNTLETVLKPSDNVAGALSVMQPQKKEWGASVSVGDSSFQQNRVMTNGTFVRSGSPDAFSLHSTGKVQVHSGCVVTAELDNSLVGKAEGKNNVLALPGFWCVHSPSLGTPSSGNVECKECPPGGNCFPGYDVEERCQIEVKSKASLSAQQPSSPSPDETPSSFADFSPDSSGETELVCS
uniref:Uncharacterized protein n=1 Tax=Chromera velia CCMP2878 TaxID=1169474 RepID=A0A0G4GNF3_9ALVE|eukprot:Cvel_22681.t1-p1 / transcript=Cvel_22681.t1 / gene=Cvel_22681 / organism=Chromera_velia_CCMP2878 / gene_product=hypothetical protein / transcript_product=hypothetical protein / location=Cvel_scaffold2256:21747-29021(-) / protein_length=993 / sequence_SO=supercontig / SO=protein_coding / is_pseudo=false